MYRRLVPVSNLARIGWGTKFEENEASVSYLEALQFYIIKAEPEK